jgi:hypothetical protein
MYDSVVTPFKVVTLIARIQHLKKEYPLPQEDVKAQKTILQEPWNPMVAAII